MSAAKRKKLPQKLQDWVDARKRYHLSHAVIQMARELGMNPKRFGKIANHKQEPWKAPLPVFIAELYLKRFGRQRPETVRPIEQIAADQQRKKAERKARKQRRKEQAAARQGEGGPPGAQGVDEAVGMKQSDFNKLVASIKEAGQIKAGRQEASRKSIVKRAGTAF